MAWSISATALVICAAVQAQQNPLTVDDAIALARPITHRDPSVHSVEVRGLQGSTTQYAYVYEAPDHYHGLMGTDEFTYFAAAGSRVIIYDPRQGELLVLTSVFPGIRSTTQDNNFGFTYTFSSSNKESDPPAPMDPGLHIDLPSMFRKLTDGALQSLPGGKYRLVFAKNEGSVIATIDPSQGFAFTDIEIVHSMSKMSIEIHVNRVPPVATLPIPSTRQLRQSIAVREVPFSMGILTHVMPPFWLTIAALAPKPMAMREGAQSPARRKAESDLGETVNWDKVDANIKRDIPKLQQMLPLPSSR